MLRRIAATVALIAVVMTTFAGGQAEGRIIEDFDDGSLSEYGGAVGFSTVSGAAAHDGPYGLMASSLIRRDDAAVHVQQGDVLSVWINPKPIGVGSINGRAYFGFGSTSTRRYFATLAPNTNQFLLQRDLTNIGASFQTYSDQWYRVEVDWGIGGQISGRLYDSDGTTLLNTVNAFDNQYTDGGIAFRSFGGGSAEHKFFDTVEILGLATLTSLSTGNWNAAMTWDDGSLVPSQDYNTEVGNHTVTVAANGAANSLLITNGGDVRIGAGNALTIVDGVEVTAGGALNVAGTLHADSLTTAGQVQLSQTATLNVPTVDVSGGTLSASANVTVNNMNVSGGAIQLFDSANLNVATMEVSGGTVNTGANRVVVSQSLKIGDTTYGVNPGNTFTAKSPDILAGADIITLSGGTLTVSKDQALPGALADPLGYWAFDEVTDGKTPNAGTAGSDYDGVLQGNARLATAGEGTGKIGGAMHFDGNGDLIRAGDLDTGSTFTVAFWARWDTGNPPAWNRMVDKKQDGQWSTNNGWSVTVSGSNNREIHAIGGNGSILKANTAVDSWSAGGWHHVAVVFDRNTNMAAVYADGDQTPKASGWVAYFADNDFDLKFGWGHFSYWNGLLDEMFIFDRALTGADVSSLYEAGIAGAYPGAAIEDANTNYTVTADSTLAMTSGPGTTVTLGGVSVSDLTTLSVVSDSATAQADTYAMSNLTLGGGSTVEVAAGGTQSIELIVSGTVDNGDAGIATLGDNSGAPGALDVDLTLEQTAGLDWTLGADGPQGHYVDVWGDTTILEGAGPTDGITINVLDGGGTAAGTDAYLIAGAFNAFDLSKITVNLPAGWSYTALALEYAAAPDADVLMLKGLVGGVQGDTDGDGDVDEVDCDNLLAQFGGPGGVNSADFNGDGIVDIEDFRILREFYGTGGGPAPEGNFGPETTPEPATMTLLAIGGMLVLKRRRRK